MLTMSLISEKTTDPCASLARRPGIVPNRAQINYIFPVSSDYHIIGAYISYRENTLA